MAKCRGVFAGLLLAAALAAREVPEPKYRVVTSLEAINGAADQGYRLLLPGVMRLEATPPDTYRYMAVTVGKRPRPKEFLNYLNEQGALGYRYIYNAGILEKAPHPRNYEYAFGGSGMWSDNPKLSTIPALIAQGYHLVGVVHFDAIIGQGMNDSLLERELDANAASAAKGWKVAVADARRAKNVLKDMNELAKQGYRYLAPHVSDINGGHALLMEACTECGGPYEYQDLNVKDFAEAEQELNAQGSAGFRIVPNSPYFLNLLERAAGQKQTFLYRVLAYNHKNPSELEPLLNAANAEGYAPIGYGLIKNQAYLALEKVLDVPKAP